MKTLILIGMAIVIGFCVVYLYSIEGIQINKYSNIEVVREYEDIGKGRILKILPISTYKIVETHDLRILIHCLVLLTIESKFR